MWSVRLVSVVTVALVAAIGPAVPASGGPERPHADQPGEWADRSGGQ